MGFGRGKGFTSKERTEMTEYVVKGGGGLKTADALETHPTYVRTGGGGLKTADALETNPTHSESVS